MKRTLLDDIEQVYFSLPCVSGCEYVDCENNELCKTIIYTLKSLKKYYICNKNLNSCYRCNNIENCEIIQKIY